MLVPFSRAVTLGWSCSICSVRSCLFPVWIGSTELTLPDPSCCLPLHGGIRSGGSCQRRGGSWEVSSGTGITQHPRDGGREEPWPPSPHTASCFSSAFSSSSASAFTCWQQPCQETRSNLCWQLGVGGQGCRCSRRCWHGDASRAASWRGFCAVCRAQTPLPCSAWL